MSMPAPCGWEGKKPTRALGRNHHPRRRRTLAMTVSVSPQVGTATALPRRSGWTLVSNCAGSTTEFRLLRRVVRDGLRPLAELAGAFLGCCCCNDDLSPVCRIGRYSMTTYLPQASSQRQRSLRCWLVHGTAHRCVLQQLREPFYLMGMKLLTRCGDDTHSVGYQFLLPDPVRSAVLPPCPRRREAVRKRFLTFGDIVASVRPGSWVVVSIGYQQRSLEDLLELLQSYNVDMLVDVRLTPISRKRGFSKTALSNALSAVGIEYRHERELGNPKDNRDHFRRGLKAARDRYTNHLTNYAAAAYSRVVELVRSKRIALLCYERDHSACHRSCILELAKRDYPHLETLICP